MQHKKLSRRKSAGDLCTLGNMADIGNQNPHFLPAIIEIQNGSLNNENCPFIGGALNGQLSAVVVGSISSSINSFDTALSFCNPQMSENAINHQAPPTPIQIPTNSTLPMGKICHQQEQQQQMQQRPSLLQIWHQEHSLPLPQTSPLRTPPPPKGIISPPAQFDYPPPRMSLKQHQRVSRLSTASSISMGASAAGVGICHSLPSANNYYNYRQQLQQQHNFLTIPSFMVSPPTPKASSVASPSSLQLSQHSLKQLYKSHRGELTAAEQYRYALSRAQLKASSRTSALLSGFAMIALVELIYQKTTPHYLLITLAIVTTLLVSVHLLTLLMSTCLLPYIEAHGCTKDSPHIKLKFYVEVSWLFSTCIGLILFLVEICIIFFVKFDNVGFDYAAWITTGILLPVMVIFILVSYLIRRTVLTHFMERQKMKDKLGHGHVQATEIGRGQQQQEYSGGIMSGCVGTSSAHGAKTLPANGFLANGQLANKNNKSTKNV